MSKAKILEELAKRAESGADSLAMDFASRMQRAKEQGFLKKIGDENAGLGDITSGSNRQAAEDKKVDFDYLRDKTFYSGGIPRQYAVGDADMMKRDSGTYITDDRDVSDTYGDSIPLLTNASRTKVIDFNGNDWDDIPDEVKKEYSNLRIGKGDPATDIIVDHEKKTGNFDSVLFKNIVDNKSGGGYGMPPSNVLNVFDPSNIRSTNAAFDPAKKDSSNLLADMGAGLAATGGIASMLNDAIDYGQGINQLGSNLIGGIAESLGEDALSGLSAIFSGDPYARVDLPDYSYPMTSESGQRMAASLLTYYRLTLRVLIILLMSILMKVLNIARL